MSSATPTNPVKSLVASFALVALGSWGGSVAGHHMDQMRTDISPAQIAASPARPTLLQNCIDREFSAKITSDLPAIVRRAEADQMVTPLESMMMADYRKAVEEKCSVRADNATRNEIFQDQLDFAPLASSMLALMTVLYGTVTGAVSILELIEKKKSKGPAPW